MIGSIIFFQIKHVIPGTANHAVSHCRVLPPGEFNSKIPLLLPMYPESFIRIAGWMDGWMDRWMGG